MRIFKAVVQEPELEWEFIDGSIVKAHQHSAGAASDENQAIGKSRGGNTTKIHMAVDAHGLPIDFEITGGEVHDCKVAPDFIEKLPAAGHTIADKGYDSEEVRETLRKKSSIPVIPRKTNSKIGNIYPSFFKMLGFGLLLFAPVASKKIRNRAGYYSFFSKPQTQKSSRPKPSILKKLGYRYGLVSL